MFLLNNDNFFMLSLHPLTAATFFGNGDEYMLMFLMYFFPTLTYKSNLDIE